MVWYQSWLLWPLAALWFHTYVRQRVSYIRSPTTSELNLLLRISHSINQEAVSVLSSQSCSKIFLQLYLNLICICINEPCKESFAQYILIIILVVVHLSLENIVGDKFQSCFNFKNWSEYRLAWLLLLARNTQYLKRKYTS